eukprot:2953127-Pyramimonas_sp.AAC.1
MGSETARRHTSSIFLRFWSRFCLLEGSLEGSEGTWNRLGAVFGPLGCASEAVLSFLELS